jgi:CRISPR/Cas system-associated exonuclease Cas4 (RecB family)
MKQLKQWSYSGLKTFEACPQHAYLRKHGSVREESGPAAERGTEIHQIAEDYVAGKLDETPPPQLEKFSREFRELRERFSAGDVILEERWGFTHEFNPCTWEDRDVLWLRSALDVFVRENKTDALVIDHKTGQRFGNELAHSTQLQLYTICAFEKFLELEHITAQCWYLDKGGKLEKSYTRAEAAIFTPRWVNRALKMTTATEFPTRASAYNCKWCHFKDNICPAYNGENNTTLVVSER